MQSIEVLRNSVDAVLGDGRIEMTWSTIPEAKLHLGILRQMQQQLRMVKKQAALEVKQIRAHYQHKKAYVGTSIGTAIFAGVFGRKSAGRVNTLHRDSLRAEQERAIAPYQALSMGIDGALMQIDQLKLQIEAWITLHK